jgi:hypothetical protein
MTDYDRTTVRRTVDETDPVVETGVPVATREPYRADPAETWTSRPADLRTTVTREHTESRVTGAVMVQRVVGLLFGILQALLLARIVLLLLVANHDNGIVSGILGITNGFIEPFRGMFSLDRIAAGSGSVFDLAALVALIGWTLIEALILAVLRIGDRRVTEAG